MNKTHYDKQGDERSRLLATDEAGAADESCFPPAALMEPLPVGLIEDEA